MIQPTRSKDDLIRLLVEGQLMQYVISNQLVKKGERFTYAALFELTAGDLNNYFDQHEFPQLKNSDASRPPLNGDFETVWTLEDGEYCAVWLERGTTSNLYSTRSKEEFQHWWNNNLLEGYVYQLTYPWTA